MPCGRGGVCVILLDGFICAHEGGSDSSMAQSILPENSTLARQIRTAAGHGALSHAVILSGEGDRAAAARYLAAAYVCRESERPCLRCAACRKVLEDIHPDVRWIADMERRELPVETLRELRRDVYIRPNEGERKVYIFSDCGQLNERDQNVLLKIVEEGPPYAAFLFCTETSAALLETIRSRCVEWKLRGSGEVALSGRALELCRVLAGGSAFEAAAHLAKLESRRLTREQLQELLEQVWYVTVQAMKPAALRPVEESCAEAARAMRKALGQLLQLALRRHTRVPLQDLRAHRSGQRDPHIPQFRVRAVIFIQKHAQPSVLRPPSYSLARFSANTARLSRSSSSTSAWRTAFCTGAGRF